MNNLMETLKEAGVLEYIDVVERDLEPVFERFAALVEAKAAKKEREMCIKDADDQWVKNPNYSGGDAIRKRANKHET